MIKRFLVPIFIMCCIVFTSNTLYAQLVSDNAFLQGRYLESAIAPNGSWGNTVTLPAGYHSHPGGAGTSYTDPVTHTSYTGNDIDFSYDPGHDGWTAGTPTGTVCCFYGPYFMPGTPFNGWSMQVNGARSDAFFTNYGFWNATPATSTLTGTVASYAYVPGCPGVTQSYKTGVWQGTAGAAGGLKVVQTNRLDTMASWLIVNTVFTNTTATTMNNLYYFVTGDPDNDEVTTGGSFPTNNRITYQNDAQHRVLVWGRPPSLHQDAFSSLSTKDCRAKALIYTNWAPYPAESTTNTLDQVYAGTAGWLGSLTAPLGVWYGVGNHTDDQDIAYGLIFNLGNLAPGASTFVTYAWGFNDSTAVDSAFQQPKLNVNCYIPPTNSYTISPCPLTTIPVSIVNGYWGTTTWTWSPAIGLSTTAGTINSINVLALSGTTTYTISPSDTMACDHFPSFFLTVLTCFAATSNTPCLGDTLKLAAHGDSTGATYLWYGPGIGGPFLGSGQFLSIYPSTYADTGNIYVIKTVGTTHDTTYTHVVIKPQPVITATSNGPICSGTTLNLFANPYVTGEIFSWTGPGGFTSTLEDPSIGTTPVIDSGIYKVIANLNGCKDSASIRVIVDSTPVVPTLGSNSPVCSGNTLSLTATDVTPGVHYNWSGPLGFTSTQQNPNITGVAAGASGIYSVTVTLGMCTNFATIAVTVNPTPPAPTLGSNAPICSGSALDLTASTTAGATYSWTGPNGFSSTLQNPVINPATTLASGTYSVITTLNGCPSAMAVLAVEVDSTPGTPVLSSNSPVCSGDSLLLTATDATAGVGYNWSGPGGFASTLQNPEINPVTTAASGTYTVIASLGTCTATATLAVVVNATPPAPSLTSNSPVCSGTALVFGASSTAGATYGWTGPNGFSSSLQNPTINPATTAATGTYSVIATLNNCPSPMATIAAVVDSTPAAPVAGSNTPGICEGDTLLLFANDATAGVTYNWAGPNSFTSTLQNPYIANATVIVNGQYTVTVSNGTMCTNLAFVTVSVTAVPAVTATSNSPVCTGDTLFLKAVAPGGSVYNWSGPYTFSSGSANPQREPAILEYAGVYQVTVYLNGCSKTVNDTVVINQTPPAPWVTWLTYCQHYLAAPLMAGGTGILWYPTDTAHGIGSPVPPLPPTARDTVMWFYVTQTVDGCTGPLDSIRVIVNPKPLVTVSGDTSVCPHDTARLVAVDTDPVANYSWSPGMYLNDSTTAIVTTRPETDIHYTVVASNQYGCTDTAMVAVSVYPAAVFTMGTDSVTLYPGDTYQINPATNCTSFLWFPPAGLSSAYVANPLANPDIDTRYIVYAATEWGCRTQDSLNIYVDPNTLITLPNAFTPGNGPNNEFKILKNGIAKLDYFRIWDRWGVLVFETNDIDKGWDGTYKGTPQPMGVFVYQVAAVTSAGVKFVKQGNLTLIR